MTDIQLMNEISQAELIAAQKQAHYGFGERVYKRIVGEEN